jgi:tetratricopeptide (TPR) repeat protein
VTTDSLSALKDYMRGERALRAGEYLAAAEAFQSAVAVDSSFALAWYRLSVAYEWLTRDYLIRQAAEQAFQHSGRLSEHDRRLLQAAVAARQGNYEEAEQRYRTFVADYSDDVEAWFQLG